MNGLLAMGIREEAIGEAINLGSGEDHRVVDVAGVVNVLAGDEVGAGYVEGGWDGETGLFSSFHRKSSFASSRASYFLTHAKTRRREVLMFVPIKCMIAIAWPVDIPG